MIRPDAVPFTKRALRAPLLLLVMLAVACGEDETTPDGADMQRDMTAVTPVADMSRDLGEPVFDQAPPVEDQGDGDMDAPLEDQDVSAEDMPLSSDMAMAEDMTSAVDMPADAEDMTAPVDMPADAEDMATAADMSAPVDMAQPDPLYVGTGDVFTTGALTVSRSEVMGPGGAIALWSPQQPGDYAVVVFQHGFLMDRAYYSDLLAHVASHGFVVAAPQMYAPGDNPFGAPSTTEEAALAASTWTWLDANLNTNLPQGVSARVSARGLVGHSRGAKVVWRNLVSNGTLADAVVGLDPVDGTGGPLGGDTRVITAAGVSFTIPTLIIGTGLGPQSSGGFFSAACAPAGDNYQQFYAASRSPSYQLVATTHGHLDMLNDTLPTCGFTCSACVDGPERGTMRAASAGWIVALMRGALQGDATAYTILTRPADAPLAATATSK